MFDHRPKALARHHRHGHGLGVGLLTVADRQLDLHRIEQDDPGHVPFLVRLTSWWRQTAGPTTREKSPLIGLDVSARIRAIQDQWLAANDRGCNLRSGLQPHGRLLALSTLELDRALEGQLARSTFPFHLKGVIHGAQLPVPGQGKRLREGGQVGAPGKTQTRLAATVPWLRLSVAIAPDRLPGSSQP